MLEVLIQVFGEGPPLFALGLRNVMKVAWTRKCISLARTQVALAWRKFPEASLERKDRPRSARCG